jgi:hypothetical protein
MGATGRNSVTAIGEQADKTTAATTLTKLLATGNNLEDNVNTVQSEALTGNRFSQDGYKTSESPGGDVPAEVSRLTLPMILKHAIGAEDGAPEDLGAGTGPYKHIFKPSQNLDNWLTFLKFFSDEQYWELYKGSKISQLQFSLSEQSIITYTASVLSIESENGTGAPSVTPDENTGEKLFSWETNLIWDAGGTDKDLSSIVDEFSFTHNNNIDGEDFGLSQVRRSLDAQGSEHNIDITTQMSASDYESMKADLKANNIIPVKLEIGTASDDSSPYLTIDYPKLKLTQVQANVSGPDKVTVSAQANAFWDTVAGYNVAFELIDDQDTQY